MTDAQELARMFKVLSVGTRLRILASLRKRSSCVNALARQLKITPAAISQHLRVLRDARLVVGEKRGYYVHYRANEKTLRHWKTLLAKLMDGPGQ